MDIVEKLDELAYVAKNGWEIKPPTSPFDLTPVEIRPRDENFYSSIDRSRPLITITQYTSSDYLSFIVTLANSWPAISKRLKAAEACAIRLAELYSQLPAVRDVDERLKLWRSLRGEKGDE